MQTTKKQTAIIVSIIGGLAFTTGCCSSKIEVSTLADTLKAIKSQAKEAGANAVEYEASVVTTTEGTLSLVVPASTSPTFGFGSKQEIGSKVKVTLDLQAIQPPAVRSAAKKKYLFDPKTHKVTIVQ